MGDSGARDWLKNIYLLKKGGGELLVLADLGMFSLSEAHASLSYTAVLYDAFECQNQLKVVSDEKEGG